MLPDGLRRCLNCGVVRDDDDTPCASCHDTGYADDDDIDPDAIAEELGVRRETLYDG